ncbi:MAG: aldo/keto reductase, partial [Clostridia bacterium]|nr:aldo/keto reductase [Clostridia bacterium]
MEYRQLGKTGMRVSTLGLGMEYLQAEVSRQTVISVVHKAIDEGINYFDLLGCSPEVQDNFGAAFRGFRDKVHLAGHLGMGESDGQYRNCLLYTS